MTHVTCRLTAKNRDKLRNPTLGNRVWATFFPCSKRELLEISGCLKEECSFCHTTPTDDERFCDFLSSFYFPCFNVLNVYFCHVLTFFSDLIRFCVWNLWNSGRACTTYKAKTTKRATENRSEYTGGGEPLPPGDRRGVAVVGAGGPSAARRRRTGTPVRMYRRPRRSH